MAELVSQVYEVVPIEAVRPHPENPNKGDIDSIGESLDANGFFGACLVQRSTGLILAGTHRWLAAKASGLASVPVIWADVGDEHALRILLADNGTSRNRQIAQDAVARIMKRLGTHKGTGYNAEEQSRFIASIRPTLGYLDALNAATDDEIGEPIDGATEPAEGPQEPEDGQDDDEPPSEPERAAPKAPERHALPIVLTNAEKRAWDEYKKRIGKPKDKPAFLTLLAAVTNTDDG